MVTQKQKGVDVFVILWAVVLKSSVTVTLLLGNANIDLFFQVHWSWSCRLPK